MEIRELKEGERGNFKMLLRRIEEKLGRNGPYCVLTLKPSKKDADIEARMWNCEKAGLQTQLQEGKVVSVVLSCSDYNGTKSYVANSIAPDNASDPKEFYESADGEKMYDYVTRLAGHKCFEGTPEQRIFYSLYGKHHDRLVSWPAAVGVHHNYIGGLISHSGFVANGCIKVYRAANRDQVTGTMALTTKEMIDRAVEIFINNVPDGPFRSGVLAAFGRNLIGDAPSAGRRRLFAFRVAEKFCTTYKFVDRETLFTALLYRDIHSLTADPMAVMIGGAPSDVIRFKRDIAAVGFAESEKTRMVEHCLLVDTGNEVKPVIPEAVLAVYAEKLADIAIKGAAEEYSICTAFVAGALHDIGKLSEYDSDDTGAATCSVDGRLYGHAMIGVRMVMDCAEELGIDVAEIRKLLNCIASHHDRKEWGALVSPVCVEAEMVAALDYLDSRMDIFRRRGENCQPGEFNEESLRLSGVRVYKPLY